MLSAKTKTYASAGLAQEHDGTGVYFPDDVAGPFVKYTEAVMPAAFQRQRADPAAFAAMTEGARVIPVIDLDTNQPRPLSLTESKALVVAALADFDPALGAKAKDILDNRLEIRDLADVPAGEDAQQQYVPRGARGKDGKDDPHAGNIRYDYLNGTIDDVIMLGHETGHAIADDYIGEKGGMSGDFKENIPETQAYFIQNIVYDYLRRHPDKGISAAADRHFTATMTRNISNLAIAGVARDAQDRLGKGLDFDAGKALTEKLGPGWENYKWAKDVRDVIVSAQTAQKDTTMLKEERRAAFQALDEEVRYTHGRPMSLLSGLALFRQAQEQDETKRRTTTEALLGRNGAPSILNALSAGGIDYPGTMDQAAQDAVTEAAGYKAKVLQPGSRPQAPAFLQS
jgi:hypothetical protein